MRPHFLTILSAIALLGVTALVSAPARAGVPAPAGVTGVTAPVEQAAYTCRRAWRCGPYACGWRRICSSTEWRSDWRSPRYYWRRHEWRRHYW
jgi:hypothetical protein